MGPLMGLSLGLQGAGIFSNYLAGRSAASRISDILANEAERQRRYQVRAGGIFRDALAPFTADNQAGDRARIAADRERAFAANQGAPLVAMPGAGSAPEGVRQQGASYLARALSEGKDFSRRLARLGALSEQNFDNSLTLGKSRRGLATVADFAAASAAPVAAELGAAQQEGVSPIGDLLLGLGQVAGMGSALGMGPSWSSLFPAQPYGATGAGRMIVGANGMMGGGV